MSRTDARLRVVIRGAVQGVGFRPHVHRLATGLGLAGWVRNGGEGVEMEVEGGRAALEEFLARVVGERPPRSAIHSLDQAFLDPAGFAGFEILPSAGGVPTALATPDIATCADCLREVRDPRDRRHGYPFTNCTNCGPRYSILEALPYDRANTSMRRFAMCGDCRAEYEDPGNRRFHAQPNACPECGPRLESFPPAGDPLSAAREALASGHIVAVKGIGGFHLMADARNENAVRRLRLRKHREEKPLAVMAPRWDAATPLEAMLLASPEAPIVLVRRRGDDLAPSVAPGNPYLGILLPHSPLHHLLVDRPVVATSGNVSDEPICIDNDEARERLRGLVDLFLLHDRPIVRRLDDSIVRVMAGRPMMLRRSRGFAPLPVTLRRPLPSALGVGAHFKNATAVSVGDGVLLSQHVGDLETVPAFDSFLETIRGFTGLYGVRPDRIACDAHPDYRSTRHAESLGEPLRVQHHHAHALSCMAENELEPPVLGVAWDGTGYGLDGTLWGGEFLLVTRDGFERVAHLRTFRLPGGEAAAREPRRSALGVLYEIFGSEAPIFLPGRATLLRMLAGGVNSPITSSAGRLFDAVAALAGVREISRFEGQAATELEWAIEGHETEDRYGDSTDWEPIVLGVLEDVRRGVPAGRISAKFHNSLVEAIVTVARRTGEGRVVLTGGCFQNRYLTERAVRRLREEGVRPYWHQRVPPNDGGIALGQVVALSRR